MTWVLTNGSDTAEFDPLDGGRMTRLVLGGHELLVTQSGQEPMWWGSFVMAPWTSLLRKPPELDGRQYDLGPAEGDSAWHGVVRDAAWTRHDDRLSVELTDPWPWRGTVTLVPVLGIRSLSVTLSITATERMSTAIGWHPWFVRDLDGAAVEVVVPRGSLVQERDASDAPTGDWVAPTRRWNDCLHTPGPVDLRYPGVGTLRVHYSSDFVTLFSTHPQGVCVEPVTSAAERLDDVLDTAETLSITVELEWIEGA